MERRAPELLALLLRRGFRHADAEDAVQEAFLRAWLWRARLGSLDNPTGWLVTVAVRAARTMCRRRRANQALDRDPPSVSTLDDFEQREEACVRLAAAREAVGRLPDDLRALFVYCKVRGGSVRDAAREFHLPVGTVSGRLTRARARLRADLRSRGFDVLEESGNSRARRARAFVARHCGGD